MITEINVGDILCFKLTTSEFKIYYVFEVNYFKNEFKSIILDCKHNNTILSYLYSIHLHVIN